MKHVVVDPVTRIEGHLRAEITVDEASGKVTDAISSGTAWRGLEIIMKDMVAGGLVTGASGKGGGYRLCRRPEEYTLDEILELMEGTISPVACLASGSNTCPRRDQCQTLSLWTEYDRVVHDFFHSKKLSDLVSR